MISFCSQGPTTARETSFAQVFGRELHEAREGCRRYRAYGDASGLDKAWDIYYGVSPFFLQMDSETLPSHYLGFPQSRKTASSAYNLGFTICVTKSSESPKS